MDKEIKLDSTKFNYSIKNLRDCHNDPSKYQGGNAQIIQYCLKGKAYLDESVIADIQDFKDDYTYSIFRCVFKFNNQEHVFVGKQTCLSFYHTISSEVYDNADELEIEYSFKQSDDAISTKNQFSDTLVTEQISSYFESIKEFTKDNIDSNEVLNFIGQQYELSVIHGKGSTKASYSSHMDIHRSGTLCLLASDKTKYIVECNIDGKTHYGFPLCYAKTHYIPLSGFKYVDAVVDAALGENLRSLSTCWIIATTLSNSVFNESI